MLNSFKTAFCRKLRLLVLCWIVTLPVCAQAGNTTGPFAWQNRLLLVFAPERGNTDFQKFMRKSRRHQTGFIARDLSRISVIHGANKVAVHGAPAPDADHAGLPSPDQLYARYDIDKARFAVLLIGRDGEVNARWSHSVTIDDIFGKVDAARKRQNAAQDERKADDFWL